MWVRDSGHQGSRSWQRWQSAASLLLRNGDEQGLILRVPVAQQRHRRLTRRDEGWTVFVSSFTGPTTYQQRRHGRLFARRPKGCRVRVSRPTRRGRTLGIVFRGGNRYCRTSCRNVPTPYTVEACMRSSRAMRWAPIPNSRRRRQMASRCARPRREASPALVVHQASCHMLTVLSASRDLCWRTVLANRSSG